MNLLDTVNEWIVTARGRISKEVYVPLIDDISVEMSRNLFDAWMLSDDDLREALENALSRNPDDVAVRFVALNAYYQLMTLKVAADEEEAQSKRQHFRQYLAYLVRLRDVDQCTTLVDLRWEIANCLAVADFARAEALAQLSKGLLPFQEYHYVQGRLHFIIALAHTWDSDEGLEHWDLPIGPQPAGLRSVYVGLNALVLYTAGVNQIKIQASITDDALDHLRDAIKHLDKVLAVGRPSARFMIARSYSEIGDHHNAGEHYRWLIDNWDEVNGGCAAEAGPLWNNETTQGIFSKLYDAVVTAYEKSGDVAKAIEAVHRWIAALPEQLGTFERLARLHQQAGDYHAAYEWLRKEADRNPKLTEDPNVSIALALGGLQTPTAIEGLIAEIAKSHPDEHRPSTSS